MKKIIIFLAAVVSIFIVIVLVTNMQKNQKLENNPYQTKDLKPETIDQLDDPLYQNIILPDTLNAKIDNKEDVTVYFFSPVCSYCNKTTPIVSPLAEEMDIDLVQFNVWEFEEAWDEYNLEATPVIIHYENGKEKDRITGYWEKEEFESFFKEKVK